MYRNVFEINKDGKSIKLFLFIYSGLKQAKIISNSVNSQISQWGYTLEFHGIRTMNKKEKKENNGPWRRRKSNSIANRRF